MYRYFVRLRKEASLDNNRLLSLALHERLNALSTAINALQLVDHAYAWIESQHGGNFCSDQGSPNKRARSSVAVSSKSFEFFFFLA